MPSNDGNPVQRKCLYLCAETPERRQQIERLLGPEPWKVLPTAQHGQDLVKILQAGKNAGIIFCDVNERAMESLRLLDQECPDYARFVVCSPTARKALRSLPGVPPTILPEGATSEEWAEKITRGLTLHQWMMRPEIRLALPRLRTIPTLPATHQAVVEALQSPDFQIDGVTTLISRDISLTVHLLKVVNSAAFGLTHPIQSVSEAITFLGVNRLKSLVVSAWAFHFINEQSCPGFSPNQEWEHAVRVAAGTQELAKELGVRAAMAEAALTAGMLHDVGKLLLASNAAEGYELILLDAEKGDRPLWQVEKEYLGYSHAEIGACMLGIWGTPMAIVEAVAWHHQPLLAENQKLSPLTLVHVADCKVRGVKPLIELQTAG